MKKKLVLTLAILILIGSFWFVRNLIAYNNCWGGLSPALRDEWENTGKAGGNHLFDFIGRGLSSGCPSGLETFREPQTSIQELRDAVRQLGTNQDALKAEIEDIKNEMKKRDEADSVAEASRQKEDSQTQR